jgi:tetratricopeptide (TPR) repeat protein
VSSRPAGDRDREYRAPFVPAPALPEELEGVQLDAQVRGDLRGLRKDVADEVAQHLVAAGTLLESDPERALVHARYARSKASRLAVVREAAGLAAYRAGEWNEAISELRAARRMGGGPGHLAVLADAERALGRPEKALEVARGPEARDLDRPDAIELLIVAAGARRDLGQVDAAVVSLQIPELDPAAIAPWSARLFYAYADLLLAAGRRDEAIRWFLHAAQADDEELTDASVRLSELAEPEETMGDDVASDLAEPAEVEPAEVQPAEVEPAGPEPAHVVPVSVERHDAESAVTEQAVTEQAVTEQAVTEQAVTEPAGGERVSADASAAEPDGAEPSDETVAGDPVELSGDPAR